MKTLTLALLLCLFASSALAEVYKYRDNEGNIVFSDQHNPAGSEELIHIQPPNSVPSSSKPKAHTGLKKTTKKNLNLQKDLYSQVVIASPTDDSSIRANDGVVTIKVRSTPPLDAGAGDLVKVYLDGIPAAQGISTNIQLENLDRGEHNITAQIIDADGQVLKKSESVKFFLLKHSINFKK